MSFFFGVEHHGKTLTVGTHGGTGVNSLEAAFLESHDLPFSLRDDFRAGLHALKRRQVDVFVGNHAGQSHTKQKYARLMAGDENAFVDPTEWAEYLDSCERNLDNMIAAEAAQK